MFQAGCSSPPPPVTLLPHIQNFVYQPAVYLLWLQGWKGSGDSLLNILLSYSLLPETKSLSHFHLHHALSTIIIISGVCTSLLHLIHRSKIQHRRKKTLATSEKFALEFYSKWLYLKILPVIYQFFKLRNKRWFSIWLSKTKNFPASGMVYLCFKRSQHLFKWFQ